MLYKDSFSLEIYGKWREFKQVTKPTAAKLFEQGKFLIVTSSNVSPCSFLFYPCPLQKSRTHADSFEQFCNEFRYYNCDSERGKYIRFFVEI